MQNEILPGNENEKMLSPQPILMHHTSLDTETLRVALVDKPADAGELQVEKPLDFEAKQRLATDRR